MMSAKARAMGIVLPLVFASGCGVKGNPIPPAHPPEIGRGRPEVSRPSQPRPADTKTQTSSSSTNLTTPSPTPSGVK
jgi:hypothetical protein